MRVTLITKPKNSLWWDIVKQFGTQAALGRYLGLSPTDIGRWVSFQEVPSRESVRWQRAEPKLLLLGYTFDDLFPPEVIEATGTVPRSVERELKVTPEQLAGLTPLALGKGSTVEEIQRGIATDEAKHIIESMLEQLSPRLQQIVRMRYGLDPYDREHTFEEIAQEVGVTNSRIAEQHRKALSLMRHPRCSEQGFVALEAISGDTIERPEDRRRRGYGSHA